MSIGTGLPQSLRPEAELSLPPQVTGLIEGESLLHISGLKLVDGPHKEQALQVLLLPSLIVKLVREKHLGLIVSPTTTSVTQVGLNCTSCLYLLHSQEECWG